MEFKLTLSLDNAAFDDPTELSRILRVLADKVDGVNLHDGLDPYDRNMRCMDVNGNTVGFGRIVDK